MASSLVFIIGAVLVAIQFFAVPADALYCYTCNDCWNTLGAKQACYDGYQCAEMKYQTLNKVQTMRFCAGQCPSYGSSTVSVKCCFSDYCNSATQGTISTFVGVVALLVPAVVRLF